MLCSKNYLSTIESQKQKEIGPEEISSSTVRTSNSANKRHILTPQKQSKEHENGDTG